MLGFKGPAHPSPTLGDALNVGFGYQEVQCLGCDTNQTVALVIARRPKARLIDELERYMQCLFHVINRYVGDLGCPASFPTIPLQ
jgi:hypothetical protein